MCRYYLVLVLGSSLGRIHLPHHRGLSVKWAIKNFLLFIFFGNFQFMVTSIPITYLYIYIHDLERWIFHDIPTYFFLLLQHLCIGFITPANMVAVSQTCIVFPMQLVELPLLYKWEEAMGIIWYWSLQQGIMIICITTIIIIIQVGCILFWITHPTRCSLLKKEPAVIYRH